ncbi:MAG: LysM peptidoglycan-binding domain-containing protein [Kiritimatiellales bacterium]|nr:LysM peptidoglycan-binding domain-containing protein [Kiritimatiellales bacterium]
MKLRLLLGLGMLSVLSGCETYLYTPQQRTQDSMRMQATSQVMEERMRRVEGRSEAAEMENARLAKEIEQLRADLRTQYASLSKIASSMQTLEQKQARDKQDIINQISGRLETLLKKQAAAAPPPRASRGSGYEHTVSSGETLSAIAQAYGTTITAIKRVNKLSSDNIRIGQKLFIPE